MSELFVKTLNPTGYGWNDKYSYSKISTYEKCGFKFKLQYVDKLKAKELLSKALKIDPDSEEIKTVLKECDE